MPDLQDQHRYELVARHLQDVRRQFTTKTRVRARCTRSQKAERSGASTEPVWLRAMQCLFNIMQKEVLALQEKVD